MTSNRHRKQNGIHYTPPELADFLAQQTWQQAARLNRDPITILDPACGDGRLLDSLVRQIPSGTRVNLVGFETEPSAAALARDLLNSHSQVNFEIRNHDFLDFARQQTHPSFDVVITNPPYVRTQLIGQRQTRKLAAEFNLTGRIDLYQVFTAAITRVLNSSGLLGLLTSNRFMYVQAGISMRSLLQKHFNLISVTDLGDTKLFDAAVLPVVVIGRRTSEPSLNSSCLFTRVYRQDPDCNEPAEGLNTLFKIIGGNGQSRLSPSHRDYRIEKGRLDLTESPQRPWSLRNQSNTRWLRQVEKHCACSFAEIAEIKVGIKTTADAVFIRDDWEKLAIHKRPEDQLLKPLLTHHVATRWRSKEPEKHVLYPYLDSPDRTPVQLNNWPGAKCYLEEFHGRLAARKYLIDAGRQWFEIWVPQQPAAWWSPKLVWPDISEFPRFFLDATNAVVNGDCYWIKLQGDLDEDWLYLMLAVANSSLAVQFYDHKFHNKLYARRRRFMTQYVREFPLPDIEKPVCREIVRLTKRLVETVGAGFDSDEAEREIDQLVACSFGFRNSNLEGSTCYRP